MTRHALGLPGTRRAAVTTRRARGELHRLVQCRPVQRSGSRRGAAAVRPAGTRFRGTRTLLLGLQLQPRRRRIRLSRRGRRGASRSLALALDRYADAVVRIARRLVLRSHLGPSTHGGHPLAAAPTVTRGGCRSGRPERPDLSLRSSPDLVAARRLASVGPPARRRAQRRAESLSAAAGWRRSRSDGLTRSRRPSGGRSEAC
jgi:hypothetical protein